MNLKKPPRTRKQERAREKRMDSKAERTARLMVFMEDQRCRFPFEATSDYPCSGEDELCHMADHSRAQTMNKVPGFRHDPRWLLRMCNGHHQGPYSYDGGLGGKRFTVVPMTDKEFRGPCRFVDLRTGKFIGIN